MNLKDVKRKMWVKIRGQAYTQIWGQIYNNVQNQVADQVRDQVNNQVGRIRLRQVREWRVYET